MRSAPTDREEVKESRLPSRYSSLAEHATRLAALHTVTEEKETIRCELENVKVAKAASDAAASDARAMREDLANEAEAFERSVRAAVAAKEAEWSARDDAMTRKAEENDAKLEEARETTRRLFVVHAAQRRAWASERVELLRRAGDASDAAGGGADASKHVQAAVEVAFNTGIVLAGSGRGHIHVSYTVEVNDCGIQTLFPGCYVWNRSNSYTYNKAVGLRLSGKAEPEKKETRRL